VLLLLGWPWGLLRLALGGSRSLGCPIDMSFYLMQQSDELQELYKVGFSFILDYMIAAQRSYT
jgi:hypothetical protein